jgi:CHRD domain-containing protein
MRTRLQMTCLALFVAASSAAQAQSAKTFKARLAPVPIDVTMQSTIAGTGSVTATLTGTKLTVTGTFSGLKSPATTAQMHKSAVRGVRGPVAFDLTVLPGTSGTIGGSVDLTELQLADLQNGRLYVQLHSEKAPNGNLWGWLLPAEGKK